MDDGEVIAQRRRHEPSRNPTANDVRHRWAYQCADIRRRNYDAGEFRHVGRYCQPDRTDACGSRVLFWSPHLHVRVSGRPSRASRSLPDSISNHLPDVVANPLGGGLFWLGAAAGRRHRTDACACMQLLRPKDLGFHVRSIPPGSNRVECKPNLRLAVPDSFVWPGGKNRTSSRTDLRGIEASALREMAIQCCQTVAG